MKIPTTVFLIAAPLIGLAFGSENILYALLGPFMFFFEPASWGTLKPALLIAAGMLAGYTFFSKRGLVGYTAFGVLCVCWIISGLALRGLLDS